jgi:hypothetical protein
MPVKSPLYESDFYAWSREQVELLRAGTLAKADIEHIAEKSTAWAERKSASSSAA